jgi:hypothetical protein
LIATYRLTYRAGGGELGNSEAGVASVVAGWPCYAVQWVCVARQGTRSWYGAVPLPGRALSYAGGRTEALPILLLWPGFLVNTLLYAIVVSLIVAVFKRLVTNVRAMRDFCRRLDWQCGSCGYDLKGLDTEVCPECGRFAGPRPS